METPNSRLLSSVLPQGMHVKHTPSGWLVCHASGYRWRYDVEAQPTPEDAVRVTLEAAAGSAGEHAKRVEADRLDLDRMRDDLRSAGLKPSAQGLSDLLFHGTPAPLRGWTSTAEVPPALGQRIVLLGRWEFEGQQQQGLYVGEVKTYRMNGEDVGLHLDTDEGGSYAIDGHYLVLPPLFQSPGRGDAVDAPSERWG